MNPGALSAVRRRIRQLRLRPHPEGGFYRETYRSPRSVSGGRSLATSILFLLPRGAVSRLHRIRSDEVWYHHGGGEMVVVELDPRSRRARRVRLGAASPQHVVKAGVWFGAYPAPGAAYALVGCGVAPGFDFRDFELGRRADMLGRFPRHRRTLVRLTAP